MEIQNTVSLTAQQIFDIVLAGLRAQGKASVDSDGDCMYRGNGGSKCAAGLLIPDEAYDPKMEKVSAPMVIGQYAALYHLYPHSRLIDALQYAHDQFLHENGINAWEDEMHNIALRYKLTYSRGVQPIPALISIDPNLPATAPFPAAGAV